MTYKNQILKEIENSCEDLDVLKICNKYNMSIKDVMEIINNSKCRINLMDFNKRKSILTDKLLEEIVKEHTFRISKSDAINGLTLSTKKKNSLNYLKAIRDDANCDIVETGFLKHISSKYNIIPCKYIFRTSKVISNDLNESKVNLEYLNAITDSVSKVNNLNSFYREKLFNIVKEIASTDNSLDYILGKNNDFRRDYIYSNIYILLKGYTRTITFDSKSEVFPLEDRKKIISDEFLAKYITMRVTESIRERTMLLAIILRDTDLTLDEISIKYNLNIIKFSNEVFKDVFNFTRRCKLKPNYKLNEDELYRRYAYKKINLLFPKIAKTNLFNNFESLLNTRDPKKIDKILTRNPRLREPYYKVLLDESDSLVKLDLNDINMDRLPDLKDYSETKKMLIDIKNNLRDYEVPNLKAFYSSGNILENYAKIKDITHVEEMSTDKDLISKDVEIVTELKENNKELEEYNVNEDFLNKIVDSISELNSLNEDQKANLDLIVKKIANTTIPLAKILRKDNKYFSNRYIYNNISILLRGQKDPDIDENGVIPINERKNILTDEILSGILKDRYSKKYRENYAILAVVLRDTNLSLQDISRIYNINTVKYDIRRFRILFDICRKCILPKTEIHSDENALKIIEDVKNNLDDYKVPNVKSFYTFDSILKTTTSSDESKSKKYEGDTLMSVKDNETERSFTDNIPRRIENIYTTYANNKKYIDISIKYEDISKEDLLELIKNILSIKNIIPTIHLNISISSDNPVLSTTFYSHNVKFEDINHIISIGKPISFKII